MAGSQVRVTLSLIAPALLLIFGVTFLAIWFFFHRKRFLLHLAAGCATFACEAISQVLYLPRDKGLNALVSRVFYTRRRPARLRNTRARAPIERTRPGGAHGSLRLLGSDVSRG